MKKTLGYFFNPGLKKKKKNTQKLKNIMAK